MCDFCDGKSWGNTSEWIFSTEVSDNHDIGVGVYVDGKTFVLAATEKGYDPSKGSGGFLKVDTVGIRFCPMCGRNLSKE